MKMKVFAALLMAGVLAFAPVVEPALTLPGGVVICQQAAAIDYSFIDASGNLETTTENVTVIDHSHVISEWSTGWYIVEGDVAIPGRVQVNGDVHLILADGCTLNAEQGIGLQDVNSNITIYAQSTEEGTMGTLEAGTLEATVTSNTRNAAIGADCDIYSGTNAGSITINGGKVTAISVSSSAAAIGGGDANFPSVGHITGSITINGGIVTAKKAVSANYGAAIGAGGDNGGGGNVTGGIYINGGTVIAEITATSENYGAAIGARTSASPDGKIEGGIHITGGTVIAKITTTYKNNYGAAIGAGGVEDNLGIVGGGSVAGGINITGGTVTAEINANEYNYAAAIGAGGAVNDDGGNVTGGLNITGGTVTAKIQTGNGNYGAAIGAGGAWVGNGGNVTGGLNIQQANVMISVDGTNYADGIGDGETRSSGTGGTVTEVSVTNSVVSLSDGLVIKDYEKGKDTGIFIFGDDAQLVGTTVTLPQDYTLPAGKTLTIGENQTLIIPEGVTLTVNGEMTNNGSIINYGTVDNKGTISGNGTVYSDTPVAGVTVLPISTPEPTPEEEPSYTSTPIEDGFHKYSLGKMYYVDGKRVKGLYEIDGETYYFDEQGFMQTGWVEFDEGWRYFAADGKMATGWLQIGNAWYYLDPETGLMYNDGPATIGKSTYYFYDWGGMASDWWYEDEAGDWYFFGGSGAMKAAQWLDWKGDWYYLTETGRMAVDTEIGGYHVNANGVWAE